MQHNMINYIDLTLENISNYPLTLINLYQISANPSDLENKTWIKPYTRLVQKIIENMHLDDFDTECLIADAHYNNVKSMYDEYLSYYHSIGCDYNLCPLLIPYQGYIYNLMVNQNNVLKTIQEQQTNIGIIFLIEYTILANHILYVIINFLKKDNRTTMIKHVLDNEYTNDEFGLHYINSRLNRLLELYFKELKKQCNIS